MKAATLILALTLQTILVGTSALAAQNFALSPPPQGSSALPAFQAFQTQVRQKLASLRTCTSCSVDDKTITITLAAGDYYLDSTFELTADDSAPAGGSVTWQAAPGSAVRILGAKLVTQFKNIALPEYATLTPAQRANIQVADLAQNGISHYGKMQASGFTLPRVPFQSELFFNRKPLALSRHPNTGWMKITAVTNNSVFTPDTQLGFDSTLNDGWFLGYWGNDWAYQYIQAASLSATSSQVTLAAPLPAYAMKSGQRIALLNTVEYLDAPGEYAIDKKGRLLLWPPVNDPTLKGEYFLSVNDGALIRMTNVSGVQLLGLEVGYTRGDAIEVNGGSRDSIKQTFVRNTGAEGVVMTNAHAQEISSSRFLDNGNEAIILDGGDRLTLTPGNNEIDHNDISGFGRLGKTYHPGIELDGVGNQIDHNEIYNGPHFAIRFAGNDHLIEYNHVHDVVLETSDAGAIYIGRDWSMRGTTIRFNYLHNIGNNLAGPGAMGVYLDDLASGTTITSNYFFNSGRAAFIGGGRDNVVTNNIFLDCKNSVHLDTRGVSWNTDWLHGTNSNLVGKLEAVHYNLPPYSVRYPNLATILSQNPLLPDGNVISGNLMLESMTDFNGAVPLTFAENTMANASLDATKAVLDDADDFEAFISQMGHTLPASSIPNISKSIGMTEDVAADLSSRFDHL